MKLAMITPDAVAHCMICGWAWKAPTKPPRRRKRNPGQSEHTLTLAERMAVLEKNVLGHLYNVHDRMLLTKEEIQPAEEGLLGKIYYNGRRPMRI